MSFKQYRFTEKRFLLTLLLSMAAFVLFTGQVCSRREQPAPPPAGTAPAAQAQASETVPAMDMRNLTVESLKLAAADGKIRATLATDENGAPAVTLFDANGGARSRLTLDGAGNPFLDLYNGKGEIVTSYWVEDDAAFLTYRDKSGNPVTVIPKEAQAPVRVTATTGRSTVKVPTAAVPAASSKPLNADYTVYYNSKSRRYHLRSCHQLKKGGNRFPISLLDATTQGFIPCNDCQPPRLGVAFRGGNATASSSGSAPAASSSSPSAAAAPANAPTVYVNSKSRRYHVRSCLDLKEGKNKFPLSLTEARAQGYNPCSKCQPPQ